MIIRIDSREQRPYKFDRPVSTGAMAVGDYSLCNLEDQIAIERKTIDDLIGCLTKDRERFERELHKGKALEYFCLVIEASPKSMIQSLIAFSIRYRLPIWFAGNRRQAERLTESLLEKFADGILKRFDTLVGSQGES